MFFFSPFFTMVQHAALKKKEHICTNMNISKILKGKPTLFLLLEFRLFTFFCYYKQCCNE